MTGHCTPFRPLSPRIVYQNKLYFLLLIFSSLITNLFGIFSILSLLDASFKLSMRHQHYGHHYYGHYYYDHHTMVDIVHWTLSNGHFCFVYFFFVLFFFFTFLRMNHFVHASHKHSKYSVFYLSNKEDAFHILDDWPVFHLALINSSYQIDTIETSISFSLAIYIIQNNLNIRIHIIWFRQ